MAIFLIFNQIRIYSYSLQGRLRRPTLTLRVWRSIQGGKRHSRREIFQKKKIFFQFFEILNFYIFLVIPRSWGVHRYPWFQNRSINMARTEVHRHTHMNCALLYRFVIFLSKNVIMLPQKVVENENYENCCCWFIHFYQRYEYL